MNILKFIALSGLCAASTVVIAQTGGYPNKPVRIVVPYPPGGAVDVVTRKMAQKLTEQTGQSFIVENKPGATGTIGVNAVAQAAPDGYTLVTNDTTYALLPHIFKTLPFDHATSIVPVSAFVFAPMGLAVTTSSPYKTMGDLVNAAKANAGNVKYGSGGAGTSPHFASEAFGIATGVKLLHIPFKGAGEAMLPLLSGTINMQISSTPGLVGNVKGGKIRLLGITGEKRLDAFPGVPTFSEAGVKNFGVINWTGLWAPKGTPSEVLARLQKEIATAMESEDMRTFSAGLGADARAVNGEVFAAQLREATALWGNVAKNTAFERQ